MCGESSGGRFREGLTTKVVPVSPPENVFFCVAVFVALQFFLRCSFFCVAVFVCVTWLEVGGPDL